MIDGVKLNRLNRLNYLQFLSWIAERIKQNRMIIFTESSYLLEEKTFRCCMQCYT